MGRALHLPADKVSHGLSAGPSQSAVPRPAHSPGAAGVRPLRKAPPSLSVCVPRPASVCLWHRFVGTGQASFTYQQVRVEAGTPSPPLTLQHAHQLLDRGTPRAPGPEGGSGVGPIGLAQILQPLSPSRPGCAPLPHHPLSPQISCLLSGVCSWSPALHGGAAGPRGPHASTGCRAASRRSGTRRGVPGDLRPRVAGLEGQGTAAVASGGQVGTDRVHGTTACCVVT